MKTRLLALLVVLLLPATSNAQTPTSAICTFERVATVQADDHGKIATGTDETDGDLVLVNLNTATPTATGNLGAMKTEVIQRTKDAIWLAAYPPDTLLTHAPVETLALFLRANIVMHAKTEVIESLDGSLKPLGFVEIGRCRSVQ
jgi:hypothetical protein